MGEKVEQVARILGKINDAANTIRELQSKNAALETEAAALREAVRVLGAEVRDWRSAWAVWNNNHNPRAYIANKESTDVDTNPIASAAVKGGGQ